MEADQLFTSLCESLGLTIKTAKNQTGTRVEFAGFLLDSASMRVTLSTSKHEKALTLLHQALQLHSDSTKPCSFTLSELQHLTGYLQFIARIVPGGQLHLRHLYSAQAWFPTRLPQHICNRRRITTNMRHELEWWFTLLSASTWTGISLELPVIRSEIHIWTDAASTIGIGGYYIAGTWQTPSVFTDFSQLSPPPHCILARNAFSERPNLKLRKALRIRLHSTTNQERQPTINLLELFAIFRTLELWGDQFRDHSVHFHCDNLVVVNCILRQTTRSSDALFIRYLRTLLARAASLNLSIQCHWLPSSANNIFFLPPAYSRLQYLMSPLSRSHFSSPSLNHNHPPRRWLDLILSQTHMSAATAIILWQSLAPSTRHGYLTGLFSYLDFCQTRRFDTPIPATTTLLLHWLTALASSRSRQASTIQAYLTGVKSHHIDLGLHVTVFDSDLIRRFLRGINNHLPQTIPTQLRREGDLRYRRPILKEDLQTILDSLTTLLPNEPATLGLKAVFSLAWTGFCRIGEITYERKDLVNTSPDEFASKHLVRRSITFEPTPNALSSRTLTGMRITFPSTKTSFLRPIERWIAAVGGPYCPVHLMAEYFCHNSRALSEPLFFASGNPPMPFTRQHVVKILQQFHHSFNGHSFRRGAATWAAQIGLSEADIQSLGRWASATSARRYIEESPQQSLALSSRFQTSIGLFSSTSSVVPSRSPLEKTGVRSVSRPPPGL
ncbi:hypothetical protein BJ508DRAFT_310757 [Ascobolus immersus RN42]|uniref:Core-binding (CB) domain-containing protein n=1 Tax=Ascobolus immersus RN42 TaxID=1160509 RepID=A0A3N4HSJ5_ASCIM|nr:hypothetical protein BJ508DRAFT_310757 [Ascobolus immersus RN42]